MLKVCITFDYELFLGKNYLSEDEVLFAPTDSLLEVLRKNRVGATIFADVCSVFQYKKFGQDDYVQKFEEQLSRAIAEGQDVQLHIHSNWLKSSFADGEWNISTDGYRLHEYGFDPQDPQSAVSILREGKAYLEALLRKVKPEYRCVAYRAGGFCIQPEKELLNAIRDVGIRMDSSVAIKQVFRPNYDFSVTPKMLNWWIDPSAGIQKACEKGEGLVFEVPIGYARNSPVKFLGIPLKQIHVRSRTDGGVCMGGENHKVQLSEVLHTLKRRFWSNGILSLDTRGYKVLMRDLFEISRRYHTDENDCYVAIICHPKLASEDTIRNMDLFIQEVKKHPNKFGFASMSEIAQIEGI